MSGKLHIETGFMNAFQRRNGKSSEKRFKGIVLTEIAHLKRRWKRRRSEDLILKKQGEGQ
jgi:hypothetical protein